MVVTKRSHILKQICSFQVQLGLSMCDLFVTTRHYGVNYWLRVNSVKKSKGTEWYLKKSYLRAKKYYYLLTCQIWQLEISLKRFMGRPTGKTEAFDNRTLKTVFSFKVYSVPLWTIISWNHCMQKIGFWWRKASVRHKRFFYNA